MQKEFFSHDFDANSSAKLALNGKRLELSLGTDVNYIFGKLREKLINDKWTGKLAGMLISAAEEYVGLNQADAKVVGQGQGQAMTREAFEAQEKAKPGAKLPPGAFTV